MRLQRLILRKRQHTTAFSSGMDGPCKLDLENMVLVKMIGFLLLTRFIIL